MFTNPSMKKEVVTSIRRSAATNEVITKEVVGLFFRDCNNSVFPYDFNQDSDNIMSDLLMSEKNKQRSKEIQKSIFRC